MKAKERNQVMKAQDVMTRNVWSCSPDTNLAEATALMWEGDFGVLPVVDDGGKTIGIITDRDISIALGTRNKVAADVPVKEVMSTDLFCCHPEDDIHAALKLMKKDKVHRVPVVNDEGVLEGIISINDLALRAEEFDGHRTSALTYADVMNTIKAICAHRHHTETQASGSAGAAS